MGYSDECDGMPAVFWLEPFSYYSQSLEWIISLSKCSKDEKVYSFCNHRPFSDHHPLQGQFSLCHQASVKSKAIISQSSHHHTTLLPTQNSYGGRGFSWQLNSSLHPSPTHPTIGWYTRLTLPRIISPSQQCKFLIDNSTS